MKKQVVKCWFGPIQCDKIMILCYFLRLHLVCSSRGLRHKNPVKTNTESTFYVADFKDVGLKKANRLELFWANNNVKTNEKTTF